MFLPIKENNRKAALQCASTRVNALRAPHAKQTKRQLRQKEVVIGELQGIIKELNEAVQKNGKRGSTSQESPREEREGAKSVKIVDGDIVSPGEGVTVKTGAGDPAPKKKPKKGK